MTQYALYFIRIIVCYVENGLREIKSCEKPNMHILKDCPQGGENRKNVLRIWAQTLRMELELKS